VHPGAQGTGLGRRLLEFAEQEAARRELTWVSLYTNVVMTESQAVYTRLGYREVRRATEHGYRRIFMTKDLAAWPAYPDCQRRMASRPGTTDSSTSQMAR
jgi:predicted N-acetyltransferase YhbS